MMVSAVLLSGVFRGFPLSFGVRVRAASRGAIPFLLIGLLVLPRGAEVGLLGLAVEVKGRSNHGLGLIELVVAVVEQNYALAVQDVERVVVVLHAHRQLHLVVEIISDLNVIAGARFVNTLTSSGQKIIDA